MALRTRYPAIEARHSFHLDVGDGHEIYVEECGNPKGIPILFVHGGPGSNTEPAHRQYFDPEAYRIILFDQRGAGKSRPHAHLEANTTWHLVADIEKIREKLGIQKWILFGGSWGSTLSLSYALKHTDKILGLILRGIFLCRKEEIRWFYQFGAHHIFPDEWERYQAPIPESERQDFVKAYYKRLTSTDPKLRLEACRAWARWEGATLKLIQDPKVLADFSADEHAVSLARIECHYFNNGAFFESDNWILENAQKLQALPIKIIHGRYDVVCPIKNAWELHKVLPQSELEIIADAGHAGSEPGIVDALVRATDDFRCLNL